MAKQDLSPGCGTVITRQVGNHEVTIVFSSDPEKAREARRKMVEILTKPKKEASA